MLQKGVYKQMPVKLRVASGRYKGLPLSSPSGLNTRPTSSKVRAAVISMFAGDFQDASVLELYAGTGSFGILTLSEGASLCVFVEQDKKALASLRANVAALKKRSKALGEERPPSCMVAAQDVLSLKSKGRGPFDFIFLDPPYHLAKEHLSILWGFLKENLKEGGKIVIETASTDEIFADELINYGLVLERSRRYGKTRISVVCHCLNGEKP